MATIKTAILYLWQLPQHLLGLLLWAALRLAGRVVRFECNGTYPGNVFVTIRVKSWGVSLGRYIFLDEGYGEIDRKHERGHSIQSLRLGPLYLFAVGIPSALGNNLWNRLFHRKWGWRERRQWYYSRYPEKQADALGGVTREREG